MAQPESRDIGKLEGGSFPELSQIWRDERLDGRAPFSSLSVGGQQSQRARSLA